MKRHGIVLDAGAPEWGQRLQVDLNRVLDALSRQAVRSIEKARLPLDGSILAAVVPDAAGGAVLAFFDGADWRRSTDRTVVT